MGNDYRLFIKRLIFFLSENFNRKITLSKNYYYLMIAAGKTRVCGIAS